jgi:PP-loop superfamily ATP-utilizing enzyme
MFQRNLDIREAKGKIPMWLCAEKLCVSENTFIKWMRTELGPEKKEKIMAAITEIKAELEEYGVSKITKDSRPAV